MKSEINGGRRLRKRGNCSLELHDSRQLHSCLMLPISAFLICLTLIVVVLLCYWLNVALAAIFGMFHGYPNQHIQRVEVQKEKLDQYWLRPKAINSSTMDSNLRREGTANRKAPRKNDLRATTFESFRPDEVLA